MTIGHYCHYFNIIRYDTKDLPNIWLIDTLLYSHILLISFLCAGITYHIGRSVVCLTRQNLGGGGLYWKLFLQNLGAAAPCTLPRSGPYGLHFFTLNCWKSKKIFISILLVTRVWDWFIFFREFKSWRGRSLPGLVWNL